MHLVFQPLTSSTLLSKPFLLLGSMAQAVIPAAQESKSGGLQGPDLTRVQIELRASLGKVVRPALRCVGS